MNKNRHIIGELQDFFEDKDSNKAISSISTIMNSIRLQSRTIGSVKNLNSRFTCFQVLQLLALFPFFSIRNAANYSSSALGKLFVCHKDMFYRFMNYGKVNWRSIIYSVFTQHSRMSCKTAFKSDVRCAIIDDTALPKTGFSTERIGKVFSHTKIKLILGFKVMFLCFTDGVSQFLLDFSLHCEKGRRSDMPQDLSKKQAEDCYSKGHSEDEHSAKRGFGYFTNKIEKAISMLRRSICYYTVIVSAKLSGIRVNLFFYRKGKNGNWNALHTSEFKLDAKEAFRLYSRRWIIEVDTRR